MDDPWGSPWADEQNDITNTPLKVAVNPAPSVKTSAPKDKEISSSPWGGSDDGFREWATMPADTGEASSGVDLGASSYTWDIPNKESGKGQLDRLNDDSRTWNHATMVDGESEKLSPGEPSRIIREPSPDPWATRSVNDVAHIESSEEFEGHSHEVDSDDTVVVQTPKHIVGDQISPPSPPNDTDKTEIENGILEQTGETIEHLDSGGKAPEESKDPEATSQVPEIDPGSSRPSTSPSDHSRHDDVPDSSRTSLEEDTTRPQMPRQVSSKVHDLVEHFDGLAKSEIEEEVEIGTEVRRDIDDHADNMIIEKADPTHDNADDNNDDDDEDDFGDFEEGTSETDLEEPPKTPVLSSTKPKIDPVPNTPEAQSSTLSSPDYTPRKDAVQKDFGLVEFPVDESQFPNLFPGTKVEVPERIFIPDVIPHDSFSSVEQRKTWYRISRYGTMKRHDAGDDENYIRTTWAQSEARAGTLKIVARWMEEDRISGRVVLGGGSKGSSLFGWNDSSAGAVPLDSAFAKSTKKPQIQAAPILEPEVPREWPSGLVKPRSTSKRRSSSKPRRRSSTKSSKGSVDMKRESSVPVASFGWSSESQDSRSQTTAVPVEKPEQIPRKKIVPKQQATILPDIVVPVKTNESKQIRRINGAHTLSPIMQTPTTAIDPSVAVAPPALNNILAEEDDWGELISTPPTTTAPKFPPSKILGQKPAQTDALSPAALTPKPAKVENTAVSSVARPFSVDNSGFRRIGVDGVVLEVRDSVASNVDESLFTALGGSAVIKKESQTATISFSTDDLDPWGSPSIGNSAGNNNTSLFDAFNTTKAPITHPVPRSADSEPDPWATPKIPPNRDTATFDTLNNKPFAASESIYQTPVDNAPQTASPGADPWASADFSFFDSPTAPVESIKPKVTSLPVAKPKRSVGFSKTTSEAKHIPSPLSKVVVTPTSFAQANPVVTPSVRGDHRSRAEIEQDKIVAAIIKGLPDLSYMLRR